MKSEARRAAVAAYKERKVIGRVYAVRCVASGKTWVGHWPNIETIQTRLWFTLRQGTHPRKELLEAWRRHGEAQFTFEIMGRLEDGPSSYTRDADLKEHASHWRKESNANPI